MREKRFAKEAKNAENLKFKTFNETESNLIAASLRHWSAVFRLIGASSSKFTHQKLQVD